MELLIVDHKEHGRGIVMHHQIETVIAQTPEGPNAVPMSFLLCAFLNGSVLRVVSPDDLTWVSIPALEEDEDDDEEEEEEEAEENSEESGQEEEEDPS